MKSYNIHLVSGYGNFDPRPGAFNKPRPAGSSRGTFVAELDIHHEATAKDVHELLINTGFPNAKLDEVEQSLASGKTLLFICREDMNPDSPFHSWFMDPQALQLQSRIILPEQMQ